MNNQEATMNLTNDEVLELAKEAGFNPSLLSDRFIKLNELITEKLQEKSQGEAIYQLHENGAWRDVEKPYFDKMNIDRDKVIELAKKCNADLTTFDGEPLSYTFAIANLEKFVELLQSQSEPLSEIQKLQDQVEALESLRPVWATGHTSDSVAAQISASDLASVWKALGVTNQTECMQKLAQLILGSEQDKVDAEKYRAINTPEISDFIKAIELEALHQRDRWGAEGDAGKADTDWFWLIGYLAGKAINKPEKALHHIITTAAACLNWHGAKTGHYTYMRAGIEPPIEAIDKAKEPA